MAVSGKAASSRQNGTEARINSQRDLFGALVETSDSI